MAWETFPPPRSISTEARVARTGGTIVTEAQTKHPHEHHKEQVDYWNGPAGAKWVEEQERMDTVLAPVSELLFDKAAVRPGETVLDVGCGCGSTALELARRVGPKGHVLGIDVSEPMLGHARHRGRHLPHVKFIHADAAHHPFDKPFADLMVSRFGVMFFGDPALAFRNLRTALVGGGRTVFACWRTIAENPWMQVPLHAAYEHVARLPKPGPEDPGPLSFADPERVTRILTAAGFAKPRFTPADLPIDIAAGEGLENAVSQSMKIGPTSRALQDQPDAVRAKVANSIRAVLKPYAKGNAVALNGGIWLVEAGLI